MMGNMDPEKLKEIQAAYEQAMKDPETAKKVNAQIGANAGLDEQPHGGEADAGHEQHDRGA